MSAQQLDAALSGLLQPDNATIKTSRRFLTQFVKQQACVAGLMSRLSVDAVAAPVTLNPGVRQIAAVLLHKYINKHWGRLPVTMQQQVQHALLHLLTQEPEPLVRRAIGTVISKLAKHLLPGWDALLQLIEACAAQADPRFREQAMLLLYQTAEPIGRTSELHFGKQSLVSDGVIVVNFVFLLLAVSSGGQPRQRQWHVVCTSCTCMCVCVCVCMPRRG